MPWNDRHARERVIRVESLLEKLESLPGPLAQAIAMETVEALVELYGEGLARVMQRVQQSTDPGLARALADDELIAHLLLAHDLHPVGIEARVTKALAPYGDTVELLGVEDGVARLRIGGSCPSTANAIKEAVHGAALELDGVEANPTAAPLSGLIPPGALSRHPRPGQETTFETLTLWAAVGQLPQLDSGCTLVKEILGEPVLFLRLDGTLSAYRPACPACGLSLEGGALGGSELACATCGRRDDLRRGGEGVDTPQLQLEPVPLLVDAAGLVKVAVGAGGAQ